MTNKATWEDTEEPKRRYRFEFVAKTPDANEAIDLDAEVYRWLEDSYGTRYAKRALTMDRVQFLRRPRDRFNQVFGATYYLEEHYEVTVRFKTEAEAVQFKLTFC